MSEENNIKVIRSCCVCGEDMNDEDLKRGGWTLGGMF